MEYIDQRILLNVQCRNQEIYTWHVFIKYSAVYIWAQISPGCDLTNPISTGNHPLLWEDKQDKLPPGLTSKMNVKHMFISISDTVCRNLRRVPVHVNPQVWYGSVNPSDWFLVSMRHTLDHIDSIKTENSHVQPLNHQKPRGFMLSPLAMENSGNFGDPWRRLLDLPMMVWIPVYLARQKKRKKSTLW